MKASTERPTQEVFIKNRELEPEGERIRAELQEFLERNKIVGILLSTPTHEVDIDIQPRLPARMKQVLTVWGSIYVRDDS